jgi:hypothetical protein
VSALPASVHRPTPRGLAEARACFAAAAADVPGSAGALLRWRVRRVHGLDELQALEAEIVAALPPLHPRTARHREALHGVLAALAPVRRAPLAAV